MLLYVGIRCHTANRSQNFVLAQKIFSVRRSIAHTLGISYMYATGKLCIRSGTLAPMYEDV